MTRIAGLAGLVILSACGTPRVLILTGTTIGLKATPGDGQSRPPQVTLGYKRAEVAVVPTAGGAAKFGDSSAGATDTDAFSTLAAFDFQTSWFGKTELSSFLATGFAAQHIQKDGTFEHAFATATLHEVPEEILARQKKLNERRKALTDAQAQAVLRQAGFTVDPGKTPTQSLQDRISHAETAEELTRLESAFFQAGH